MIENAIFLIETIEEAKYFVERLVNKNSRFINADIYSLNPNINAYLKMNGISCHSSAEVMGADFYDSIMDKCHKIEMSIINYIKYNSTEMPPDYYVNMLYYYLRQIWRHILWNIQFIDHCLSSGNYDQVYGFIYNEKYTGSPWIDDDQLYLGALLKTYCHSKMIQFDEINVPLPIVIRKTSTHKKIFKFLAKFIGPVYYRGLRKFSFKDNIVLVPDISKNMDKVCIDIKQKNGSQIFGSLTNTSRPFWYLNSYKKNHTQVPIDFSCPLFLFHPWIKNYNNTSLSTYFDKVVDAIKVADKKLFFYKGTGFRSMLLQKVEIDLKDFMHQAQGESLAVKRMLEVVRPQAVVSQMGVGVHGALGHWAKELNIPAVLISHGSHVAHENQYAKRAHEILAQNILTSEYEYLAVQSPLAKEIALLSTNNDRVFNINPAIWGRKINKKKSINDILHVIHAGTLKYRHQRRYIYETADEYVSALIDLCNAVRPCKKIRLLIKTRPQDYELSLDSLNFLLSPLPENTVIETEKPFSEVLSLTNLLVSFSSTTIEEALVNEIPVLLYGGHGRYAHIPVEPYFNGASIEKAVTFIKNKDLLAAYFAALNKKGSSFSVDNKKFDSYRFKDADTVEFSDWFADKMKSGAIA